MNEPVEGEIVEREFTPDIGALEVINKSEINVQIATAKRFPRSVTKFQGEAISLVSLNEETADGCVYAIPRDGKTIEGPSARFAEVVAYSWGNCRAGARVMSEDGDFVTAMGIFWDLEKNTAIGYEVKRRIVDSKGRRYKPDMIGVTANAACSIALRNAILKGVPKAIWAPAYEKARATIMGDFETLANRRSAALASFQKFGVTPDQIFEKLSVKGEEDVSLEHILVLRGLLTAIRDGDTTVEETFAPKQVDRGGVDGLKAKHGIGTVDPKLTKEGAGAVPPEPKAEKPQAKAPPVTQRADVVAAITKLSECDDGETLRLYAEALPEGVRGNEDFTKAFHRRLGELAEGATKDPKAKQAGTPRLRKQFVERFGRADADTLDVAYDETRGYIWSNEDAELLQEAFEERKGKLEEGAP